MKIALIGSSGFIGSELAKEAEKRGHSVVCIDRMISDEPNFHQADLTEDDILPFIKDCDAVVCLAAVRPTKEFGLNEYLTNIKIAGNTMDACIRGNIKNGIFISSRSVYSDDNKPWKESDKNVALNLYGEAKAAVDNLAEFYNKYNDMNFKSLRLAQVMGLNEVKGYLLNTLIDNASAKKESVIYGKGTGKRQYIYIKDVINSILHACAKEDVKGIFNIGMEDSISIADLAEKIYQVFEDPGHYRFLPDKPEDTNEYLMSLDKTRGVLGFSPVFEIDAALKDIAKDAAES